MPKLAKPLTDYMVRTIKPTRLQAGWLTYADGGCRGLLLRVSPRGEKVWGVRTTIGNSRHYHTIGAYPNVPLAAARVRATEYLSAARDGVRAGELDAKTRSFKMLVRDAYAEYIGARKTNLREATLRLKQSMFALHISPCLGDRQIRTIRRPDVYDLVSAVANQGYGVQAIRVFAEFMAFIRWCDQKGYVDGVPSIRKRDLRSFGAAKEQARSRVLSDAEIVRAWDASASIGALSQDLIRLLLLTGQRRDEVRLMTWDEVDLDTALWTIPATRYKTGIVHHVPLSAPALEIIRARWSSGAQGFVFDGRGDGKPFNGAASTLRRLQIAVGVTPKFTLHDLRRTVRTGLARLGIPEETAELVIGHKPKQLIQTYNLHDRLSERRLALDAWAGYVSVLCTPKPTLETPCV